MPVFWSNSGYGHLFHSLPFFLRLYTSYKAVFIRYGCQLPKSASMIAALCHYFAELYTSRNRTTHHSHAQQHASVKILKKLHRYIRLKSK